MEKGHRTWGRWEWTLLHYPKKALKGRACPRTGNKKRDNYFKKGHIEKKSALSRAKKGRKPSSPVVLKRKTDSHREGKNSEEGEKALASGRKAPLSTFSPGESRKGGPSSGDANRDSRALKEAPQHQKAWGKKKRMRRKRERGNVCFVLRIAEERHAR